MIDKILKHATTTILFVSTLFAVFILRYHINKDTQELKKQYPLVTKGNYTYTGYIVRKYRNKEIPTIEVVGYGRFVISEEEYEQLDVGTMVPDYIVMRSQDGKAKEELKTVKKDQTK